MKKIYLYIQSHFLLRNIILAICFVVVFFFVVSVLLNLFTRHNQKNNVPNMIGMSMDEAREAAKPANLTLVVIDSMFVPQGVPGTVLDQSPRDSTDVKSGRKIFLTINSFRPRTEIVPYVTGVSLRQAKNKLESKGFEIERLIYRPDMATNNILAQSWKGKPITKGSQIKAEIGSKITLTVGRNGSSPMPIVPKVIGLTLREAQSRLWEIGFNLGEVRYDPNIKPADQSRARVYKQTPLQESRSDFGTNVTLQLTNDTKKLQVSSSKADVDSRLEVEIDTLSDPDLSD